jgi:hypothetical protein
MKNPTTGLAVTVVILAIATLVVEGVLTITPSSATAFDVKKGKGGVELGIRSNGNTVSGQQKAQRQLVCSHATNNCLQEGLTSIGAQSPPTLGPILHVTQRIGLSKTITPGDVGIVSVSCNPGEIATGGGYTSSENIIIASSLAGNSNTGWLVNAFNNSTQNGILAAIAECASLVG